MNQVSPANINEDYCYRIVSVFLFLFFLEGWGYNLVFALFDDVSCDVASPFSKPASHLITKKKFDSCKK